MQKIYKFLSVVIFFMALFAQKSWANESLIIADSLFENKEYTESYELYNNVLESGKTSKSMLLKMAFVQEGLHSYPEALKYLYLSEKYFPDEDVAQKIERLAEKQNYPGHKYTDDVYIFNVFKVYKKQIVIALFILVIVGVIYLAFGWFKHKKIKIQHLSIQLIATIALVLVVEFPKDAKNGLVTKNKIYYLTDPSAGGDVIQLAEKGSKIVIEEEVDIWYKTKLNDTADAFIRKNNLVLF